MFRKLRNRFNLQTFKIYNLDQSRYFKSIVDNINQAYIDSEVYSQILTNLKIN